MHHAIARRSRATTGGARLWSGHQAKPGPYCGGQRAKRGAATGGRPSAVPGHRFYRSPETLDRLNTGPSWHNLRAARATTEGGFRGAQRLRAGERRQSLDRIRGRQNELAVALRGLVSPNDPSTPDSADGGRRRSCPAPARIHRRPRRQREGPSGPRPLGISYQALWMVKGEGNYRDPRYCLSSAFRSRVVRTKGTCRRRLPHAVLVRMK